MGLHNKSNVADLSFKPRDKWEHVGNARCLHQYILDV